jgi:hypothetical protein
MQYILIFATKHILNKKKNLDRRRTENEVQSFGWQ